MQQSVVPQGLDHYDNFNDLLDRPVMDVIDNMILKFGGQLRKQLVQVMQRTGTRSSDSRELSMDSVHPYIGVRAELLQ